MSDHDRDSEERREAEIVSRHLDLGYTAHLEGTEPKDPLRSSNNTQSLREAREQESSLKLQGGDIHRDLYKLGGRAGASPSPMRRAQTFSHPETPPMGPQLDGESAADHRQPGGVQRHFVQQHQRSKSFTAPITRNFVQFLDIYGSRYALVEGNSDSDAIEDEEEEEEDEEQGLLSSEQEAERRPLLGRRKTTTKPGNATLTRTFFLLIKSFVGTGVLFLPKAFKNGGLLFSLITLMVISLVSCLAFHLLLQCRTRSGASGYGDIAHAIGGKRMRSIVLASIALSQLGFVCAGIIFAAENVYSFLEAVASPISIKTLIAIQVLVLVPLAFIRNISKLGGVALLADLFILLGLGYIYYFDISSIAKLGVNDTVQLFNPRDFTLTIGSAIFTFEGIGLILPIQSSMKQPEKFERLLYIVMLIITIVFASVGALSYMTFGETTTVEIISNLPQDSKVVNAVQFLYSLAVLAGDPVQLFPAMRIVENSLFGHRSGKRDPTTKWRKNAFRTSIVILCGVVSALGAADLDKFVALIGSFACVPLVYIYPAFLHFKGVAEHKYVKMGDVLLMSVGLVAMIYTTAVTIARWSES
ncbi:hypothetical protein BDZ45DRAFT_680763 [Acephala macrosclerotiorum]|nr:hypothetical protein BDZ45DRAFT_680763 [Acephala macrosclerotiorum]